MPGDPVRFVSQSSPHDFSIESIATLLNPGLLSHNAPHSLYIISFCIILLFVFLACRGIFQIIKEIAHKNKMTVFRRFNLNKIIRISCLKISIFTLKYI